MYISTPSPLKDTFQHWLWKLGIKLYKVQTLPRGLHIAHDLARSLRTSPRLIFDVGANVGQTATLFARYFPSAMIYSFEPVRSTYLELLERTRHLAQVRAINLALGASEAEHTIVLQPHSWLNSLQYTASADAPPNTTATLHVTTLANFCQKEHIQQIDILKIDTEGYDMAVLEGALPYLEKRLIRWIVVEVSFENTDEAHSVFGDVHSLLTHYGFGLRGFYHQYVNEKGHLVCADALFEIM